MKSKILNLIVFTSFVSAHAAQLHAENNNLKASNLSYNYAGIRFLTQDLDDINCSQSGINLNASLEVQEELFIEGSFTDVSGDNCGSSSITTNIGYHVEFNTAFDLYGTVGLENISPDNGDGDSGIVAAVGLRGFLDEQLEAKIELYNRTSFDGDAGINGSAVYWFDPKFSATFDLGLGSDATTAAIGARMKF